MDVRGSGANLGLFRIFAVSSLFTGADPGGPGGGGGREMAARGGRIKIYNIYKYLYKPQISQIARIL
jgi:hypothetical protein